MFNLYIGEDTAVLHLTDLRTLACKNIVYSERSQRLVNKNTQRGNILQR